MNYQFDIGEITQQVASVISFSQGFNMPLYGLDKLISNWLDAKKDFIELLDGKLIYEYPQEITFSLNDDAKKRKFESFVDDLNEKYELYSLVGFMDRISVEEFFQNKLNQSYTIGNITVPEGMKTVKAFKFFISDSDLLRIIQDDASRIIQENVCKGRFCLSVHPLDFLSASENNHNWRSCHALDGDYRAGNLSVLMDNSTIMCYLRSDNQEYLRMFPNSVPWNSKKWRMWLYFSTDKNMIFAGRQYPFTADSALPLLRKEILPELTGSYWTKFTDLQITATFPDDYNHGKFYIYNSIPVGDGLVPLGNLMQDSKNSFQFNDVLHSSFYTPLYAYRMEQPWHSDMNSTGMSDLYKTKFRMGKACICPVCGENNLTFGEGLCCSRCAQDYGAYNEDDGLFECECCGQLVPQDDMYYISLSNVSVCQYCYENEVFRCADCGDRGLSEDVRRRDDYNECLCNYCYAQRNKGVKIQTLFYNDLTVNRNNNSITT